MNSIGSGKAIIKSKFEICTKHYYQQNSFSSNNFERKLHTCCSKDTSGACGPNSIHSRIQDCHGPFCKTMMSMMLMNIFISQLGT